MRPKSLNRKCDGKEVFCLLINVYRSANNRIFFVFQKNPPPLFIHGMCLKPEPCGAMIRNKYLERNIKLKIRSKNPIVELKVHCGMKVNANCAEPLV